MAMPPPAAGADPSMDEILASIRKILNEDEAKAAAAAAPPTPAAPHAAMEPRHDAKPAEDVLLLDEAMIVPSNDPLPPAPIPGAEPPPASPLLSLPSGPAPAVVDPPPSYPTPQLQAPVPGSAPALVSPAAAGAAGASVEALIRTLARERTTATHRGGPTIEDLVRDEMRPLLRDWLDTHLPPMVERLVRAEIERVVRGGT